LYKTWGNSGPQSPHAGWEVGGWGGGGEALGDTVTQNSERE